MKTGSFGTDLDSNLGLKPGSYDADQVRNLSLKTGSFSLIKDVILA